MAQRFVLPFQTVFDALGAVAPGAQVYFYAFGAGSPQDTFADQALTIPNTNPVVANSAGLLPNIWLQPLDYRLVAQTSENVQLWDTGDEPVSALGADGSDLLVTPTGSILSRSLADSFADRINVKYYAVGDAVYAEDGAITGGLASFGSASASFTTDDVGKLIDVEGAATNGTTITNVSPHSEALQVFQVDDTPSANAFVDITADFNDAGTADVLPFPATEAIDDYVAFGYDETFARINIDYTGGTAGVGGVVAWEYWNGAWTALTGMTDNTTGFTAAVGAYGVSWTLPSDWTTTTLSDSSSLYFVRARVTTVYSTNPVLDTGTAGSGAGLIRITTTLPHTFATSESTLITGVGGTTEANNNWTVTKIDDRCFDLQSSTFANSYTSSGTAALRSAFDLIGVAFANAYTSGGTAHGRLSTTIASITNTTTIVLSATAGATVSGAAHIYGTDDRAGIATADAVAVAADKPLYFPACTYFMTTDTTISSPAIFDPFAILVMRWGTTTTFDNLIMAGAWKIFEPSGSFVLGSNSDTEPLVRWWGAIGDGATDDRTESFNADASTSNPIHYTAGTYLVESDLTFTSDVIFDLNAKIEVATGVTVTFARSIVAGWRQIFSLVGTGALSLNRKFNSEASPLWFGDTVTVTTIQNTVDVMQDPTGTNTGGRVLLPSGLHNLDTSSASIDVTGAVTIMGTGMGHFGSDSGGTLLRNTTAAGDVFNVAYSDSVILRDFRLDAQNATKSSGTAFIRLAGTGGAGNVMRNSRIKDVFLVDAYDGVVTEGAQKLLFEGVHIIDYLNIGIYFKQTGATDQGGNVVGPACTFWDLNVGTSSAGIRYDKGGALHVMGSNFQGSDYSFQMELDDGDTGTLMFTNNSMEEFQISAIKLGRDSVTTSNRFGNVVIIGNEISSLNDPASSDNAIQIDEENGTTNSDWIKNITITGNVFNMAITATKSAIDIGNCEGGVVANNVINGNGAANYRGILSRGSDIVDLLITDNVITQLPSNRKYPALTSTTTLRDTLANNFADLRSVADGSVMFVSDALEASDPLTGSSTGTFAFRLNSAWKGI